MNTRRTVFTLAASAIWLFYTGGVVAYPGGVSGFSGASGATCTACHNQNGTTTVSLNAVSGTTVAPGSVANFELSITGGPAVEAGLDVAASGGSLIATASGTQIQNGELTHTSQQPSMSGGSVTLPFNWQAPAAAGTYTLYAAGMSTNNDGGDNGDSTGTTTLQVTVSQPTNQPPTASISGPATGEAGVAVTFDGSGSSDPDGSIVDYAWDFGDSSGATGQQATHAFAAGTYTVALTVTDNNGATANTSMEIQITATNVAPVAAISGPSNGTEGVAVTFDGTGSSDSDGNIVAYSWDFGDNTAGANAIVTHTFAAGSYTVTLMVTDNDGAANHATLNINIVPATNPQPPVADTGGPYNGTEGVAIQFDGSASNDPDGSVVSYEWNFGDGNTGTGVGPVHIYTTAGTYTVQLTVTDDSGDTGSSQTTADIVAANPPPQAPVADTGGPYNGTINVAVLFDGSGSTDPDGSVVGYEWDFGDGSTGNGASPSNTYTAAGTYTVQLTVTDDSGDTDSSQTTAVIVASDPTPPDQPTETNGETLYNTYCASCHGAKGSYEFRREVGGEDAGDIREAFEDEKEMSFLGNILTSDDINAIAAYINGTTPPTDDGKTTPPPDGGTTDPNGESLYNTYCGSCHGAKGTYEFRREVAGEDAGDISSAINEVSSMASLANVLTQADIDAIAAYINDQAPPTGDGHADGDHHSRGGSDDSSDDNEKPSDMSRSNPFADEKLGTGALHWLVLSLAAVMFYRRRRISKL
jgi:PKD repeat protein